MEQDDGLKQPTRRDWVGYWSMIVQQTQNAFNDKAAQFTLVPLGGAIGFAVESWATILIALPFVLFAPLAGWLSDRFSKRDVMLGSAVAQLLILGWLCGSIVMGNMPLALCGFFALAVQSAFFSPAKIGINKELVGSQHLGFAAGVQQMMAMLAILAGQITAGIAYDWRYSAAGGTPDVAWQAALVPMVVLAGLGVPAIIMAWIVPRTPPQGADRLTPGVAVQHFKHLGELWADLPLRRASFAVAFFWGFAAFINLWSVKLAKTLTAGQEGFGTLSSWFMALASLGMAAGFGVASILLRKRIEMGWVPIAGGAMTVSALALALVSPAGTVELLDGWGAAGSALVNPASGGFLWGLTSLAFFAALFLAPLNAWMQDRYPSAKRGEMQSAVNLQDCLAGITAAALIEGLTLLFGGFGIEPVSGYRIQLVIAGLVSAGFTWFVFKLFPGDAIRVVGVPFLRWWYRLRPVGAERVPEKGGVLLLANHVTYADAFVVTALCPRPVRFVMAAEYERNRWVRGFARLFDTVLIEPDRPREAIRATADALQAGDVVCVFPEGQLSRTGMMNELQRGFGLIARVSGAPVVPMHVDGMWCSFFSYSGGGFFTGMPRRLRFPVIGGFGEPMDPAESMMEQVSEGMWQVASDCLTERMRPSTWEGRLIDDIGMDGALLRRIWANGFQIGSTAMISRGSRLQAWRDDDEVKQLVGLVVACPKLCGVPFGWLEPGEMPAAGASVVGGRLARERIGEDAGNVRLFDFSPDAVGEDGVFACLAVDRIVVAVSVPDPKLPSESRLRQEGSRAGCRGKLLRGFVPRERDGRVVLEGAACPPEGIELPEGSSVDAGLFVRVP